MSGRFTLKRLHLCHRLTGDWTSFRCQSPASCVDYVGVRTYTRGGYTFVTYTWFLYMNRENDNPRTYGIYIL